MKRYSQDTYDRYLTRLTYDLAGLWRDYNNLMELWKLMPEYRDELKEISSFYTSVIKSLRISTVIVSYRLFENRSYRNLSNKSNVSIVDLIDIASKLADEKFWIGRAPSKCDLDDQEKIVQDIGDTLRRLEIQRHNAYGHLSHSYIIRHRSIIRMNAIFPKDINRVIEAAETILCQHCLWRYNNDINFKSVVSADVGHMLELMRVGRDSLCNSEAKNKSI